MVNSKKYVILVVRLSREYIQKVFELKVIIFIQKINIRIS
jgi:hypothetical protein